MKKIITVCAILCLFNSSLLQAQDFRLSPQAKVSVLTIGVANEAHTFYGHTGLRFKDSIQKIDLVFNFGYFDFSTPNFLAKFVKGDLQYFVAADDYYKFEYVYREENRSIFEQELALTLDQKQKLFTSIYSILYSNDRYYTYKFIDENCTTMVIDKLNQSLGSTVIKHQKSIDSSYRTVLYPYTNNHFFQQLGINLIFGTKVDQKGEKLFLPLDLYEALKITKVQGKPLVSKTTIIFDAKRWDVKKWWDSIYLLVAVLFLLILVNKKWITWSYFFVLGVLGCFFCLVGFYSWHEEVLWNYNVLLINPLYLLLLYFNFKNKQGKLRWIILLIGLLLLLYLGIVWNKVYVISILPIVLTNSILLFRWYKKTVRAV